MPEILNRIKEEKVSFLDLWFSVILGSGKNLTIPIGEHRFLKYQEIKIGEWQEYGIPIPP